MKKYIPILLLLIITARVDVNVLGKCFVEKKVLMKKEMKVCHKDNHQCMVKVVTKVCNL